MHRNFYKIKNKNHTSSQKGLSLQSGMTLIELMVVLAIFLIVAGLTIFDYGRFRSTVSLQNLADDISLSVRRAQNFAIGVRSGQSSVFSNGYGIHFSTATPSAADARAGSSKAFIIFNDLPTANNIYNYPVSSSIACNTSTLAAGDECIDLLSITSNDTIASICPNGTSCAAGYADITFLRPNPDAYICTGPIGGSCSGPLSSVDIVIRNGQSLDTKTISVSNIGQISVR